MRDDCNLIEQQSAFHGELIIIEIEVKVLLDSLL